MFQEVINFFKRLKNWGDKPKYFESNNMASYFHLLIFYLFSVFTYNNKE